MAIIEIVDLGSYFRSTSRNLQGVNNRPGARTNWNYGSVKHALYAGPQSK